MVIKNKKILITAGPTWVPIDSVRVISNMATGKSGLLLAEKLNKLGAKVTLLLGPVACGPLDKKINVINFRFFSELKKNLIKELKSRRYDVVIHSAAVSDYRPSIIYRRKIRSGLKNWRLNLIPTEKIIDLVKRIDQDILLIGFKFEPQAGKNLLISKTRQLLKRARLDLAVANTADRDRYCAYIINRRQIYGPELNKRDMAGTLIRLIGEQRCRN